MLVLYLIQVGRVNKFCSLFGNGCCNSGMCMAEAAHGNTAECIEILPALGIPEPDTLTPFKLNGQAGIGRHKMFCHVYRQSKKEKAACRRLPVTLT